MSFKRMQNFKISQKIPIFLDQQLGRSDVGVLDKHSKKFTLFATKSSQNIISSRRAGSTLKKRSLLCKKQKN
jgi:hypothetical protein